MIIGARCAGMVLGIFTHTQHFLFHRLMGKKRESGSSVGGNALLMTVEDARLFKGRGGLLVS